MLEINNSDSLEWGEFQGWVGKKQADEGLGWERVGRKEDFCSKFAFFYVCWVLNWVNIFLVEN